MVHCGQNAGSFNVKIGGVFTGVPRRRSYIRKIVGQSVKCGTKLTVVNVGVCEGFGLYIASLH